MHCLWLRLTASMHGSNVSLAGTGTDGRRTVLTFIYRHANVVEVDGSGLSILYTTPCNRYRARLVDFDLLHDSLGTASKVDSLIE